MNFVPSPAGSAGPRHLTRPVRFWTWAAILMSGAMALVISWLHFSQTEALGRSRRLILTFSEARVDLAKGFLHVALAGDSNSPFDSEVGFARLEQAIPDLHEAEAALSGHIPELIQSGLLPAFRTKVEGLRALLATYRQRPVGDRRELELPLYLMFHETEELAGRLEGRVRDDLQALGARQSARFAITLGSAFVLLGAICAGIYTVSRREAVAIEALFKSEQQLKETNGFLSDLIEHSAAVIFVKDRDGRYELVNRRWEEETGIGREQALGKTDQQLFPGPVGERFRAHDCRVIESGQPQELEESASEGPAGRTFVSVKFPVRSGDGHIRGVCGIATDITARKHAEEALRRSETHLRTLVNTLPDLVWLKDPQGVYLSCNARFESLFGAAAEAIRGRTDYDFVSRELADFFRKHDLAALAAGGPCVNEEELTFAADGHREILETIKTPMRDASGHVVGVLGIARDITERRRTALALKASERALSEAQRIAGIGAWEWDLKSGRHTWSERVYQIYGRDPSLPPAVYPEVCRYFTPAGWARLTAAVEQALADGTPYECDAEVVRSDGTPRWITARGEAERDATGAITHLRGTVQDITERKRLEQERVAMEARMRQQQKLESIGTLASGVAHEINNPITGIMNYAQLIQDRLPAGDSLTEFTGEIMRETQRVATIVRHLLTFARQERQSHSPARLADIVDAVLSLVRTVIGRDQITLQVTIPEGLPSLKCRSQQIQQVIMNLVTNARDALNDRYPGHHPDKVLSLRACLRQDAGRRWIRLTVEDHGAGIASEVRERIFDPFFTTKGRDAGTGLGLSISHGIVKEHRGEWRVESEPGRFTRMHIDLPVDNGWEI
jgi:two-component system cell cycle sensor histidine kinase/response regulator CckA